MFDVLSNEHTQESNTGVLIGNASTLSYLQEMHPFWSAVHSIKLYEILKFCHKTVALQCRFQKTTNYQDGWIVYFPNYVSFEICLSIVFDWVRSRKRMKVD